MSGAACVGRVRTSRPFVVCLSVLVLATTVGAQQPQSPPDRPAARRPRSQRVLHQSPPGCNQNALDLRISRMPIDPIIQSGAVVTYTVTADNLPIAGGIPCDATEVNISFTCPGPDGNPTGATTVLATNDSLPSGTSKIYPSVMCTVTVNAGVTKATAQGSFTGTIHTTGPDDFASGTKTITVNVIPPTLTPTPSNTPTQTPTLSFTNTFTNTPTLTATVTPTGIITPTATSTLTPLPPTVTPNFTSTQTPLPATATPTVRGGGPGGPPGGELIPTLSPSMLVLLALALGAAALFALRRR